MGVIAPVWAVSCATGIAVAAIVAGSPPAATPTADNADADLFVTQVKPLLSNRCFKCHGPDEGARQADLRFDVRDGAIGTAIVPGDVEASEIIRRITSDDPDEVMPPPAAGAPLDATEIDAITRWIESGAPYARHWSLVPPTQLEPPVAAPTGIDAFIRARLASEGMVPSPPADRHTLIRRVTLDLTGLPPTPEEVAAFVDDDSPDAYERVVDRLLASPAFGERWASVWLDQVRYADTRGYEKDAHREIWPYRDWVIRAINDDVPFDQFTIDQIAGDLLVDPTPEQRLATAMHRNTMTNDEGGTDDEEFRVAAVMDRVETTMQVWLGLTATCARCHTHKYDPITQREYFELYAFFNQTADADRTDESPTMPVLDPDTAPRRDALLAERDDAEADLLEIIDRVIADGPAKPTPGDATVMWIDDRVPFGAITSPQTWDWRDARAHSGTRAVWSEGNGAHQSYFTEPLAPLNVGDQDRYFAHVWIDPERPAREVMIQIHSGRAGWAHRAYWGENVIEWGADGTTERKHHGDLPETGTWVRLEFNAEDVGLRPGDTITGWAFSQFDGRVGWDAAGAITSADQIDLSTQQAWEQFVSERGFSRLPEEIRHSLAKLPEDRTPNDTTRIARYYLQHAHEPTWALIADATAEIDRIDHELMALEQAAPRVPIMQELASDARRDTRLLTKGSFLSPAEPVDTGTPAALHAFPTDAPPNRLGLAHWLVAEDNPLTSRVLVNRVWSRLFGRGLVITEEDFGSQGALPSHPALLDHLAIAFMEDGWSFKKLCRRIVLSQTYRQSSIATPAQLERDPNNVLLSRGPRFRLSAEMVRDQALALSGLLSDRMYGPSVFPPQPNGVWQVVYSGARWEPSQGEDRHRRALYTYLRRTSPYPSMLTFDAPSREVCEPRRIRTNTPLQALVTLNDPVYVEAAQALARHSAADGGSAHDIARRMFERCLCRPADDAEVSRLAWLYFDELAHYSADPEAARLMATDPIGPTEGDVRSLAAWTVVASVVLNLDELLTRP